MPLRFDIAWIVLVVSAGAAVARADDAIPLRLSYDAPPACPSAEAFLAEVVARTPLARAVAHDAAARALSVVVRDVPGGSSGTLELAAPDATASVRQVSAADCTQVISALALMTALAIDPHAATGPIEAAPKPQPPAVAPTPTNPATIQAKPTAEGMRSVFEVGAQLEALGGVAADPALVIRPFLQWMRQSRRSPWSYALRISAGRAHAEASHPEGRGAFTLWAGRLELCALRFAPVRVLGVSACVPVDVGRLEARGIDVVPRERVVRPWLSVGGLGRVEWSLFDVLVLEAAAELFFPIVRDRFYVGSSATVHRAPAIAGGGSVGIGVRFP